MKVVPDKFAIEGRDVGGIVLLNGTTWTVGLKQKLVIRNSEEIDVPCLRGQSWLVFAVVALINTASMHAHMRKDFTRTLSLNNLIRINLI